MTTEPIEALLAEILDRQDAIQDRQLAILAEVQALRAEVHARRTETDPARGDLLRAIWNFAEGTPAQFDAQELLDDAKLPAGAAIAAALNAAIRGGLNPRRVGKLLSRLEGKDVDGLTVVRVETVHGRGNSWAVRVSEVSNTSLASSFSPQHPTMPVSDHTGCEPWND